MSHDRLFLLWRRDEQIVATVSSTPGGDFGAIWFDGSPCRKLGFLGFYDHLVSPNAGTHTREKMIVGFDLLPVSDDEPMEFFHDILKAENTTACYIDGRLGNIEITLRPNVPCEYDNAQGFWLEAFVSTQGKTILAIPEWDESLRIGFDIVNLEAPTVESAAD